EDAVVVAVGLDLLLLRRVGEHGDGAEIGCSNSTADARAGADADLEIVEDAVARVDEHLGVGGALADVVQREGHRDLGPDLETPAVPQEHADAAAPLDLRAL